MLVTDECLLIWARKQNLQIWLVCPYVFMDLECTCENHKWLTDHHTHLQILFLCVVYETHICRWYWVIVVVSLCNGEVLRAYVALHTHILFRQHHPSRQRTIESKWKAFALPSSCTSDIVFSSRLHCLRMRAVYFRLLITTATSNVKVYLHCSSQEKASLDWTTSILIKW